MTYWQPWNFPAVKKVYCTSNSLTSSSCVSSCRVKLDTWCISGCQFLWGWTEGGWWRRRRWRERNAGQCTSGTASLHQWSRWWSRTGRCRLEKNKREFWQKIKKLLDPADAHTFVPMLGWNDLPAGLETHVSPAGPAPPPGRQRRSWRGWSRNRLRTAGRRLGRTPPSPRPGRTSACWPMRRSPGWPDHWWGRPGTPAGRWCRHLHRGWTIYQR